MPCRGKQSVKVNDSLAKPTQEDQPSDHRCNLITDVRRQSLNLPVTQPGAVSVENKENINNAKVNGDKKKSPGFCRGEKSVDVKESKTKQLVGSKVNLKEEVVINTKAGESKKGNSKINGARKSSGSCRGQKSVEVRPSLSSSPQQEETNKNSSNVTNGNNKISSTKSGPCRGQRNVDVKDTLSTKPSETNKSGTEVETQKKDVKKTKTVTKEQSALDDGRSDVKIKADNALSGSGALPEKKPPTGRAGLCSGGSSSHLKDSLKPSKKQVERNEAKKINDGMFEEKVLHVEEQEELLDEEMEDDIVEEMETDEEEIYITSLPPPPSIKKSKKKKKKQRSSEYVDDEPDKERSLPIGSRKYKYAVTPEDTVNDPLYSSIEKKPPVKVPRKTKSGIQSSAEAQAANVEDERPTRVARQDTPQRKRKKKPLDSGQDIRSVYEKQIASLQTAEDPLDYSQGEYTMTSQPTVEEEGDLLENAEEERKKNKQRLRAKKMMELDNSSPVKSGDPTLRAYDNAQKEIDKVLGPRDDDDDDDEKEDNKKKKHKQKGKKKKVKKGEDNEAFSDDDDEKVENKEETLEEARHRMHKLLDDAFSLISHSKSSIGNKVQPSSSDDQRSQPSSAREDRSVQANMESPRLESKKHTPIHVHRSHEPYDSSGLVTWSPYRASDEIAIISLPSTQTNLSSVPPQQERLTTSTFTESMPSSIRTSYYATQPGEPIVIKTKNMDSNLPSNGSHARDGSFSKPDDERGHSHRTANGGYHQETFQNPVYENTLPLRPTDRYTDPYHGLASYQDLPVSQIVEPNKRNGRAMKPSAWQEERNKLSQPNSGSSSPRGGVIDVRRHVPPQRGEKKNLDEVDVIKESLQPGASPQPLINSLREELQVLSSKKIVENQTKKGSSDSFRMKSNGSSQIYPHDESVSSWGSMHRNTSNV